mmetsp:Transcript_25654/g.81644  ORF Transcript_25654/g.81644 Transcript_25654/m.81644 type:complete len:262 (-) Transcript_25654:306-1091(-)
MNDLAIIVQVVERNQNLVRNLPHEVHWDAVVVVVLDEREKVVPEALEHHAHVRPVGPPVLEVVDQRDHEHVVGTFAGFGVDRHVLDSAEELDLVLGGLCVAAGALLDFHGAIGLLLAVVHEPHRAEVAPAKLLFHHKAAVLIELADAHRVVAAGAVALAAFIFVIAVVFVALAAARVVVAFVEVFMPVSRLARVGGRAAAGAVGLLHRSRDVASGLGPGLAIRTGPGALATRCAGTLALGQHCGRAGGRCCRLFSMDDLDH